MYAMKVSDGSRKILYGVRKVSDGAMKVSKGERTISDRGECEAQNTLPFSNPSLTIFNGKIGTHLHKKVTDRSKYLLRKKEEYLQQGLGRGCGGVGRY